MWQYSSKIILMFYAVICKGGNLAFKKWLAYLEKF